MEVSPVGTRMAMPCSAEELVVTTKSLTYPKNPGGGDDRAGVWRRPAERVDRRVLALDGSMLRGEPR
jgi:hypothetical protein